MTPKQTMELRQSVIRSRLAEIAGLESTDEIRSEIDTLGREYGSNETSIRAYTIAADSEPVETRSTEDRQRNDLLKQANVGGLVFDLLNGRSGTDGAMQEFQKEYGLGDNDISVRMLRDDDIETRAVSPAPANVGQQQASIVGYVFPRSIAAFLGIDMPVVGVGENVYPVMTSELQVRTPAENADADETTAAFSAQVLSPARLQASFFFSREDKAKFAGMDASLRENLSDGLSDGLDKVIMQGTNGLMTGAVLANHNVTAETSFDLYMSGLAYDRVDGRYAATTGDLRVVMGSDSYAHAGATYRNASVDRTALDRMMEVTAGVRVSAHVPDAASNLQNALVRLGSNMAFVAPIWEGVTLIPDEVTLAKKGQIMITAVMMYQAKLLRADGFWKQQIKNA